VTLRLFDSYDSLLNPGADVLSGPAAQRRTSLTSPHLLHHTSASRKPSATVGPKLDMTPGKADFRVGVVVIMAQNIGASLGLSIEHDCKSEY
jgi:hypothetical protein